MAGDDVASTALAQTLASDTPDPGETERPPHQVARFEVVSTLGEGGMGVVLLANDPLLQRRIAAFERGFSLPGARPREKAQFLHNIAQCHRLLKNCDRAAFFYRRYLDTSPSISTARKTEVEALIAELRTCAAGSGSAR